MGPSLKIKHLFHHSRFPNGLGLFFLVFYIPLGLTVMLIRFFFALQLYIVLSILPKTWLIRRIILRISGSLIGIFVTQEKVELFYQRKYKMIVSNHVTYLDNIAFESLIPCIMSKQQYQVPWLLSQILKYDNVKVEESPRLVFAEETTTNGLEGLLKFSSLPFRAKNEPFVLALLTISRPYFVQIAPSVLGSYWWSDFLWLLFAPYTNFKIRFILPPERKDEQTDKEYSIAIQQFMATKLGLAATKFDVKEKMEYKKRYFQVRLITKETPTINTALSTPNTRPNPSHTIQTSSGQSGLPLMCQESQVDTMATQVKDVLPQVPFRVIQEDLRKTKCIDTTISNILEGKVTYTQESSSQSSETKCQAEAVGKAKVPAKSFSQSSTERHLSFQERKQAFIESARQRYIAKHSL